MTTQHPYYALLPSYVTPESIRAEYDELLLKAQEACERLDALRRGDSAAALHPRLERRHFRAIDTLLALKYTLPKTLHLELLDALVELLWARDGADFGDVHMELRAVLTLELLLRKWTKRPAAERGELVLSWRVAWRGLERACFKAKGSVHQAAQHDLQMLSTETVKCVAGARKFFAPTDAATPLVAELWCEFAPVVRATHSSASFKALALFSLFAVISGSDWGHVAPLLPEWFATWSSVSRCSEWDGHWMRILSRVAKKHPDATVWDAYLPFLFAKLHDSLDLPSDLGASFKSHAWPSAYTVIGGNKRADYYGVRLAVHLLRNPDAGGQQARANEYVLEILGLTKAFFHPSNVSNSANALGVSVYFFSTTLAKRLGQEKVAAGSGGASGDRGDSNATLSLEACRPLFDSLLELSFYGIYSKNRSVASKCMYVIKNIVCIDPAHCAAPVLQEMMKGLDPMAMSHAHLASTAISTMGVLLYHLMCGKDPHGTGLFFATYLSPLLKLTLPGIDANDEKKTSSTIRLYFHLFSWLPLVNDAGKGGDFRATKQRGTLSKTLFDEMETSLFADITELSAEDDQKLWELGAFLEDWSLALLDRCLDFIRSRVGQFEGSSQTGISSSKRGHGDQGGRQGGNEDHVVLEILNLMGMLYPQMSPEIYAQGARKTLRFVSDVFFTSAFGGKVISQLIHTCVQANPSQSLAPFMALALDKLRATKTEVNVGSLMANEKIWYLSIFDGVVRSNGAADRPVLQFQDEIRAVLAHFLVHEDEKDIYEAAGTVLDHLLESLVGVYPTEFRSLPPAEWADAVSKESGMFQYLGAAVSWKRLGISWHEPDANELAFAYQLLDAYVLKTLDALATVQADEDRSVRAWVPRLKQIDSAIHGARTVFVNDSAASGSLLAGGSLVLLTKALGEASELLHKFVALKATLMQKVHDVARFWQAHGTGSTMETQVWHAVIRIIHELLVARGEHLEGHRHKAKQQRFTKAMTLDLASDAVLKARKDAVPKRERVPLSSRNEMIEQVLHFYATRKVHEHFELAHGVLSAPGASTSKTLHEALLGDLEALLTNPYKDVQAEAASVMKEMSELYRKWVYARVSDNLAVLEGVGADDATELKEETVAGALTFLSRSVVTKHVWEHRDRYYARVVKAVLKSNDALLKRVRDESSKLKVGMQVEAFFMTVLKSWRYDRRTAPSSPALIEALVAMEPLRTEHWKFQLVHLVAFYPLLQLHEMPLPLSVWGLAIKQLRNDVLPVRQVALLLYAQLVRLYKLRKEMTSAGAAADDDDAVEALVYAPETMKTLVDAFVANHKNTNRFAASADGQHANSAPANWSVGVDDMLLSLSGGSAAYPRAAPLSSVQLLRQTAGAFVGVGVSSMKLVQKLVQINPRALAASGVLEYLHELAADKTDAKTNQEERQAALTTLSEWTSGLLRGFLKTSESEVTQVGAVVAIVKKVLPQVSVSLVEPWSQVLYLVTRTSQRPNLPLDRLQPLLSYLLDELEQSFLRATAEDYARQAKWLALVEALAAHLLPASAASASASAPAYPLAKELSERVLRVINAYALTHQYKIIRDRVGKLLFLLGAYGFASRSSPLAAVPVAAASLPLQQLVDAAALNDSDADAAGDESDAAKLSLYARETAIQWLACTEKYGETAHLLAVMQALFPVAFLSQNHPKAELAVLAKHTTNAVASSLRLYFVPGADAAAAAADVDALFALLDAFAAHRFWKTRGAVLRFLTPFAFYHAVFFSPAERDRVQALACSLLTDEQREVQEMAKYTLRSLVHSQRPEAVAALSARWTAQACEMRVLTPKTARRIARLAAERAADDDELLGARRKLKANEDVMVRSVLGMCAVVLAFPHSVPPCVPPMFEELGRFLYLKNRSVAVSYLEKAVKDTLLEFKRTHQDNWLETKRKFSPAQLNVIEDVSISPGYYT
ncbi:hypothetical protein PybrP1_003229 [[Pythium] brassicae (nom. inval.)]|nr:hypothetical protein PybrP1_003229 [[Pythium] brassicae (nom. inval.)]